MMEVIVSLTIVIVATFAIFNIGVFSTKIELSLSSLEYINSQLKYQIILLAIAFVVLSIIYFVNSESLITFLSIGNITAPASKVTWLGISEGTSWLALGSILSFVITLGTFTFIYFGFRRSSVKLLKIVPFISWILFFSFTNSFSEEIIFRLGVIVPLFGLIDPEYILLISAILFGLPHLRGMPSGIVGAFMAGFLGWILAKSVIETEGILWAWGIHFLQDIVIYTAFVMASIHKSLLNSKKASSLFV